MIQNLLSWPICTNIHIGATILLGRSRADRNGSEVLSYRIYNFGFPVKPSTILPGECVRVPARLASSVQRGGLQKFRKNWSRSSLQVGADRAIILPGGCDLSLQ